MARFTILMAVLISSFAMAMPALAPDQDATALTSRSAESIDILPCDIPSGSNQVDICCENFDPGDLASQNGTPRLPPRSEEIPMILINPIKEPQAKLSTKERIQKKLSAKSVTALTLGSIGLASLLPCLCCCCLMGRKKLKQSKAKKATRAEKDKKAGDQITVIENAGGASTQPAVTVVESAGRPATTITKQQSPVKANNSTGTTTVQMSPPPQRTGAAQTSQTSTRPVTTQVYRTHDGAGVDANFLPYDSRVSDATTDAEMAGYGYQSRGRHDGASDEIKWWDVGDVI